MTFARNCPECGKKLPYRAKGCACGWGRPESAAAPPGPPRCAYAGCPAAGTISDDLHGGGPFWCRWHFSERDAPRAAEISENLRRNGLPGKGDGGDARIDEEVAAHPNRQRQPEESSQAYGTRMRADFRESVGRFAAGQPDAQGAEEARLEREAIQNE